MQRITAFTRHTHPHTHTHTTFTHTHSLIFTWLHDVAGLGPVEGLAARAHHRVAAGGAFDGGAAARAEAQGVVEARVCGDEIAQLLEAGARFALEVGQEAFLHLGAGDAADVGHVHLVAAGGVGALDGRGARLDLGRHPGLEAGKAEEVRAGLLDKVLVGHAAADAGRDDARPEADLALPQAGVVGSQRRRVAVDVVVDQILHVVLPLPHRLGVADLGQLLIVFLLLRLRRLWRLCRRLFFCRVGTCACLPLDDGQAAQQDGDKGGHGAGRAVSARVLASWGRVGLVHGAHGGVVDEVEEERLWADDGQVDEIAHQRHRAHGPGQHYLQGP
eukprot:m.205636 g.205636  ORF g.205636 m.205636 type:complete len:331 (+) comp17762_c3_seq5:370-1362(+)